MKTRKTCKDIQKMIKQIVESEMQDLGFSVRVKTFDKKDAKKEQYRIMNRMYKVNASIVKNHIDPITLNSGLNMPILDAVPKLVEYLPRFFFDEKDSINIYWEDILDYVTILPGYDIHEEDFNVKVLSFLTKEIRYITVYAYLLCYCEDKMDIDILYDIIMTNHWKDFNNILISEACRYVYFGEKPEYNLMDSKFRKMVSEKG